MRCQGIKTTIIVLLRKTLNMTRFRKTRITIARLVLNWKQCLISKKQRIMQMTNNTTPYRKIKILIVRLVFIQKICLIKMQLIQNMILYKNCKSLIARQVLNQITCLIKTYLKTALPTLVQMSFKQSIIAKQISK